MTKSAVFLFLGAMTLFVGCGDNSQNKSASSTTVAWHGTITPQGKLTSQSSGQQVYLNCRKILETSSNVHFYYKVSGSPAGLITENTLTGVKETTFSNAVFTIEEFQSNLRGDTSKLKNLFNLDVDFKIVEYSRGEGDTIAMVTANSKTIKQIKAFYLTNPYLVNLKEGDEIMSAMEHLDQRTTMMKTNITKMDLPGIVAGDSITCK